MVEQDYSGNFINDQNTEDNAILTIVSDVTSEQKENPNKKIVKNGIIVPSTYLAHSCEVDNGKGIKTFNIGPQTGIRFQMSWGKDSASWIGKKFKVKYEPYMAFGKQKVGIAGYPLESEKPKA